MRASVVLALMLTIPSLPASAESMRCGKWVVSETSSTADVLEKCGEPQQKDVAREDVLGTNALGNPIKLGVKVTERWRYQRSNQALPMLVTIADGKVISIDRTE